MFSGAQMLTRFLDTLISMFVPVHCQLVSSWPTVCVFVPLMLLLNFLDSEGGQTAIFFLIVAQSIKVSVSKLVRSSFCSFIINETQIQGNSVHFSSRVNYTTEIETLPRWVCMLQRSFCPHRVIFIPVFASFSSVKIWLAHNVLTCM